MSGTLERRRLCLVVLIHNDPPTPLGKGIGKRKGDLWFEVKTDLIK